MLIADSGNAQPVNGQTMASKVLYYDEDGLIGQSAEVLGPISDSTTRGGSEGRNELVCFEGVFYHAVSSQKYDPGFEKNLFRKSTDGINWTSSVRAGDAPAGELEYSTNIYVWRKNGNIHVGISYVDSRDTYDQMRFVLSTDGGATFQPSVQIGNITFEHGGIQNCGFAGIGDTIIATWLSKVLPSNNYPTYYTITTDGGVSWLPMVELIPNGAWISDVMIAPDRTIYLASSMSYGGARNIEVRSTTNLGANWITNTNITTDGGNNSNNFVHLTKFNDNFYAAWMHDFLSTPYVDRLNFSKSTNSGDNWNSPIKINDPDTIAIWSNGGGIALLGHPKLAFSPSGTIYAVWADSREKHNLTYDSARFHVYIARSTDDGVTWSPDLKISEPSNVAMVANWYPCAVLKSDGVIDTVLIVWSKVRDVSPPVEGICEDFYDGTFPPTGWSLDYTGTQYWSRNAASAYGVESGSAKFNYWFAPAGTVQSLITSGLTPTVALDSLSFDIAYAGYNIAGNTDTLIIEISSNNGITYSRLAVLWGNESGGPLNTVPPISTEYSSPNFEDWEKRKYALPAGTNKIKFKAYSGYGNNLFLDNVCIVSNNSFTLLNLKVFPEGFYNKSGKLNIKDTVKAYLRSTVSPYTKIDSAKSVIDSLTFNAGFVFANASSGTYYIMINHRNSIETWSKSGGELITFGDTVIYDFTTSASQAYGSNQKQVDTSPVVHAIYSGDVNQDGTVDASDLSQVENDATSSLTGYVVSDLTGDDFVDAGDVSIVENNAAASVSVVMP